jgi:peptidoglycan/LPS O-acetylase OafA/YrhL
MKKANRIEILDGLRVMAILMVMLFHYYYRYEGKYYNYTFKCPELFRYFNLGVQLFFIISGFVITLTLTKSKSFVDFMKMRYVRLIPGMIICSTIIFLIFLLFDTNNLYSSSKNIFNLFFTYTFISPGPVNFIFKTDLAYIDGVNWSLWVELLFYILAGWIYFISPKNFTKHYIIVSLIGFTLYYIFVSERGLNMLSQHIGHDVYMLGRKLFHLFPLFKHNFWFLAGIILNKLYFGKKDIRLLLLLFAIFGYQMALLKAPYAISIMVIFLTTTLLFLFNQKYLRFLSSKALTVIGVASYSIYLFHQRVAYLVMNRVAVYFGDYNWIIPLILMIIFTFFGIYSYKYLEAPFSKKLKKLFFKERHANKGIEDVPIATLP